MGSPHYTQTGQPRANKTAFAQQMRAEFALVEAGIQALAESFPIWLTMPDASVADHTIWTVVPFTGKITKVFIGVSGAPDVNNVVYALGANGNFLTDLDTDGTLVWSIPSSVNAGDVQEYDVKQDGQQTFTQAAVLGTNVSDRIGLRSQGQSTTSFAIACCFVVQRTA